MFDVEKWMEVVPLVEWTAVAVDALWSGVCEARQEASMYECDGGRSNGRYKTGGKLHS